MPRYPSVTTDDWIQPARRGYRMMCCDCGLVHELDFRIVRSRVQIRARRNNRATGAARSRRRRSHDPR